MNHLYAAQIADDNGQPTGRYRYVSSNRRTGTHATGYCHSDPENEGGLCPGHGSPEEAYAHQKAHDLDKTLRFREDAPDPLTQYRCEAPECNAFTSGSASVGAYYHVSLCAEHRNRETVEQIYTVGESWSS